jgi:hypothetical protein
MKVKRTKKTLTSHIILQSCTLAFIMLGSLMMYVHRAQKNKRHFHGLHGLTGLLTVACIISAYGLGVFIRNAKQVSVRIIFLLGSIHKMLGYVAFTLISMELFLGLRMKWAVAHVKLRLFCQVFLIVNWVLVIHFKYSRWSKTLLSLDNKQIYHW